MFERVDNRWAIASTVLPSITCSRAFCIVASTSLSNALVASSSTKTGAFFIIARARAIRWRWPPESLTPRSPKKASYPLRPLLSMRSLINS